MAQAENKSREMDENEEKREGKTISIIGKSVAKLIHISIMSTIWKTIESIFQIVKKKSEN